MEKNLVLAIVLAIMVMVGFNLLFPPAKPVAPVSKPAAPMSAAPEASKEVVPARERNAPPVQVEKPEKEINIETELYTATLSTRGGVITSWRLKKYKDEKKQPLDMVVHPESVKPLTVAPEGVNWQVAGAYPYTADANGLELAGKDGQGKVTFAYFAPDGSSIHKTLSFKNGTYAVFAEVQTTGIKGYTLYMGDGFGSLTGKQTKGYGFIGPFTLVDGAKQKDNPEKLKEAKMYKGRTGWTAVTDKYFMAAIVPESGLKAVVHKGVSDWGSVGVAMPYEGGGLDEKFLIYAGPKEYDRLKALGHGLDQAVDFGWFSFIAKPLFVSLKFFYDIVHNYGWSIIIITVIIKALFAPLTHKSQKSMKKMQKLQPHFAELKEKYKGDPQRMNREMMELYKKHKVNPMGGCLPMVIQIPVFIALYNVLNNAIELRQAPFMWWLKDLSVKDPYYVLPVLMGLSMLLMQKMTPSSMDPKQNRMMMLMPVVMMFMFINLPSGLVLYFTVSNLLSIAQQFYINKYSKE